MEDDSTMILITNSLSRTSCWHRLQYRSLSWIGIGFYPNLRTDLGKLMRFGRTQEEILYPSIGAITYDIKSKQF
jgi:hypothetical protein